MPQTELTEATKTAETSRNSVLNEQCTFNQTKVEVLARLETVQHFFRRIHMKKYFVAPAALILTASLLAGCASLLGDIGIGTDPMKLEGQVVAVPLAAQATAGLSAKVDGPKKGTGNKTFTFNDIDGSSFASAGTPKKLAQILGVKSAELITTDATQAACNVVDGYSSLVTINSLTLSVTDASTSTFGATASGSFTVSKEAGIFKVTPNDITLAMTGTFTVLTTGGLNTGTIAFDVSVANAPSNCTLKLTLKGGTATIAF
jgi:predicted small secreted protein